MWYNTPHWKTIALICCPRRSPKVTLITVFVSIVAWKQARWPPLFSTFLISPCLVTSTYQVSSEIYGGFFCYGITLNNDTTKLSVQSKRCSTSFDVTRTVWVFYTTKQGITNFSLFGLWLPHFAIDSSWCMKLMHTRTDFTGNPKTLTPGPRTPNTQGQRGFWDRGSGTPGGSQSSPSGVPKPRSQNAPLSLCVRLTRRVLALFFILKNDAVNIRSDGSCKFFERCFWNVLWLDR